MKKRQRPEPNDKNNNNPSPKKHKSNVALATKLHEEDRDYISCLPDDILGSQIISRLNIRDAVHACSVSSQWRPLLAFKSDLCFDCHDIFEQTHMFYSSRWVPNCGCLGYNKDFGYSVCKFLQNSSTSLSSFKVTFCLRGEDSYYINRCVVCAIRRGVKKIVLNLSCLHYSQTIDKNYEDFDDMSDSVEYTFGSRYLIRQRDLIISSNLEDLELRSCVLSPRIISHVLGNNLKSLKLTRIGNSNDEKLVDAINSSCLKLKSLALRKCALPQLVCFSNDKIETLSIRYCYDFKEIELSATNLTRFKFSHYGLWVKLSLSKVPNLRKVRFKVQHEQDLHDMFSIAPPRATIIPHSVCKVERVKLHITGRVKFDMLWLKVVLRAFPLLRKLQILEMFNVEQFKQDGDEIVPKAEVSDHKNLEEVEIRGYNGTKNEIKFVINLVNFAANSLKRLVIKPKMQVLNGDDSWDEGKRDKVLQALQDRCFSNDTEIIIYEQ